MNVLSSILSELCLLPNIKGGFEIDGPVKVKQASTVSAAPGKTTNKLQKGNITVATLSIFHEKQQNIILQNTYTYFYIQSNYSATIVKYKTMNL